MTIEQAAAELRERYRDASWISAIGIGQQNGRSCIFLYARSLVAAKAQFPDGNWQGYPVVIRKMGPVRPAGAITIKATG